MLACRRLEMYFGPQKAGMVIITYRWLVFLYSLQSLIYYFSLKMACNSLHEEGWYYIFAAGLIYHFSLQRTGICFGKHTEERYFIFVRVGLAIYFTPAEG